MRTETAFVEPFIFQNDQFAKTGSGQTREKLRQGVFCSRPASPQLHHQREHGRRRWLAHRRRDRGERY